MRRRKLATGRDCAAGRNRAAVKNEARSAAGDVDGRNCARAAGRYPRDIDAVSGQNLAGIAALRREDRVCRARLRVGPGAAGGDRKRAAKGQRARPRDRAARQRQAGRAAGTVDRRYRAEAGVDPRHVCAVSAQEQAGVAILRGKEIVDRARGCSRARAAVEDAQRAGHDKRAARRDRAAAESNACRAAVDVDA